MTEEEIKKRIASVSGFMNLDLPDDLYWVVIFGNETVCVPFTSDFKKTKLISLLRGIANNLEKRIGQETGERELR